jgi:hypothetical protein
MQLRCTEIDCQRLLAEIKDGKYYVMSRRIKEKMIIEKGVIICSNIKRHKDCKEKYYEIGA